MGSYFRKLTVFAMAFVLAGCQLGELSMGRLSPSVQKSFEIVGSDYDRAFDMAHRALEESGLEVTGASKESGVINARDRTTNPVSDNSRTFLTNFIEVDFILQKLESGNLIFTLESKSNRGSSNFSDRFLANYQKYVTFSESENFSVKEEKQQTVEVKADRPGMSLNSNSGPIISEIRAIDPVPSQKYDFSKKEIIQIQTFLKKLGYDPGPANGEMDRQTLEAIEKFKAENKIIQELF